MTLTPLSLGALMWVLAMQSGGTNQTLINPNPGDARMNQFEDVRGTSWKVFAIDAHADGPLAIGEVQEIRQHNPPSTWAVFVRNRSLMPIASYRMAAGIVAGDGNLKAVQLLPAIKNLAPGKVSRQEVRIGVTVLVPSDRIVFFVNEVVSEIGDWRATEPSLSAMIRSAVQRLPAP